MNLLNFDIVSFLDALVGQTKHGKMVRLSFYVTSSFNGYKVERLLRQYGIHIWGREIDGAKRSFLVKQSQATWAEYVLCRAGVPLAYEPHDPRNAEYPNRHPEGSMPEPWTENGAPPASLLGHFADILAKFIG